MSKKTNMTKNQIDTLVREHFIHASFSPLNSGTDEKYRGCEGHKQKHIDSLISKLDALFHSSTQSAVRKAEERMIEEIKEKLIKQLSDPVTGIEATFCDWNSPRHFSDNVRPEEIEKWVIGVIKSVNHSKQG